jgi:hypothetical protein
MTGPLNAPLNFVHWRVGIVRSMAAQLCILAGRTKSDVCCVLPVDKVKKDVYVCMRVTCASPKVCVFWGRREGERVGLVHCIV